MGFANRRFIGWFLFLAGAVLPHTAFANPEGEAGFQVFRTEHFEIRALPEDAMVLAAQMEGRFAAYNRVFRFNPGTLAGPLRIRAFRDGEQYESYVAARIEGGVPPGAVYLHFAQPEMRELVIHLGNEAETLPFQAFIQFLRAFVPNPPVWIRDGFGVHFATLGFDAEGRPVHAENLAWLDAVKATRELPTPEAIMRTLAPETVENFPGLAWSLVSFFLNSGNDNYLRSLTEGFMVLSYANTAEENAAAVFNRIAMWNDMGAMARDHLLYLGSRDSFVGLIAEGQAAYIGGRPAEAEAIFRRALGIRNDHYAAWYYLGLLAYNAGDTETAERYYRIALGFGADNASILYALALNAATAGRTAEAIELLRQTAELDPGRFAERASILILRLDGIRERQ
ncbi:MAG: tetratricopeptide repeat protein [Treponema sp.]|nr:tetratricopeptide repeat protein [Treponema sp.]